MSSLDSSEVQKAFMWRMHISIQDNWGNKPYLHLLKDSVNSMLLSGFFCFFGCSWPIESLIQWLSKLAAWQRFESSLQRGLTPYRLKQNPILPGKSHGQRSLAGCGQRGHKESDMTEGGAGTRQRPQSFWWQSQDCGWGLPAPRPPPPDRSVENQNLKYAWGLSWRLSGKESPPCLSSGLEFHPWPGKTPRGKAAVPTYHSPWAGALEPRSRSTEVCGLQNPCSATRGATAVRSPWPLLDTARESPCSRKTLHNHK